MSISEYNGDKNILKLAYKILHSIKKEITTMPMKTGATFNRNPFADSERMKKTGERIKELRTNKGEIERIKYSRDELAEELQKKLPDDCTASVSLDSIRNFENGTSDLTASWLIALSDVLKCDPEYLLAMRDEESMELEKIKLDTGLNKKAYDALSPLHRSPIVWKSKGKDKTFDPLSWFLGNGLVKIIDDTAENVLDIYEIEHTVSMLPNDLINIFDDLTNNIPIDLAFAPEPISLECYILELTDIEPKKLKTIYNRIVSLQVLDNYSDIQTEQPIEDFISEKTDAGQKILHALKTSPETKREVETIFIRTGILFTFYTKAKNQENLLLFDYQNKCLDLLKQYRKVNEHIMKEQYDYFNEIQNKEGDEK